MYLGPSSNNGHFHPFLILPVKMVELPKIFELLLKCGRVPGPTIHESVGDVNNKDYTFNST